MTKDLNTEKASHDTPRSNETSRTVIICSAPQMSAKVADYIFDLLDDADAFEVEQHLVDCVHCKEKYLTILRVRAVATEAEPDVQAADPEDQKDSDCSEPLVEVKN